MKNFYVCLLSLFVCFTLSAQVTGPDVPHLSFMGIPIDGPAADMSRQILDKGFAAGREGGTFTGTFAGFEECTVSLKEKAGVVWCVSVAFPAQSSWPKARKRYTRFKDAFSDKLEQEPATAERLSHRYPEGSGAEVWGFEDESSTWQSVFTLKEGSVFLYVRFESASQFLQVCIDYVDAYNYYVKESLELSDI